MENKTKNAKIKLTVGIVLLVVLTALVIGEFIYVCCHVDGYGDMAINYDDLKTVMADDVLYLSDAFCENENLQIYPMYKMESSNNDFTDLSNLQVSDGKKFGEVFLQFDPNKVKFGNVTQYNSINFKSRVKNIDSYKYTLVSDLNYDGIPVRVDVIGSVGTDKKTDYSQNLQSGDRYAVLDKQLTNYITGLGKSYEVKGVVGKAGAIKRYGRLKITVTVNAEIVNNFEKSAIETRVDNVLNSALNYLERYSK